MRWIVVSAAVVVVLTWLPPVLQELTSSEGNLTLLWRHFTNPPETAIGVRQGLDVLPRAPQPVATRVAARRRVRRGVARRAARASRGRRARSSRSGTGCAPLIALDVVLAGALRARPVLDREHLRLRLVLPDALGLDHQRSADPRDGVGASGSCVRARHRAPTAAGRRGSTSRPIVFARHRARVPHRLRGRRVDGRAADAPRVAPRSGCSRARRSARSTAGTVPGGGRDGRYQVTIVDTMSINAPGYGLVSELERAGIHAGFPPIFSAIVRPEAHRDQGRGDGGHPLRERARHRGVAREAGRGRGRARGPADAGRAAGERAPARPGARASCST